MTELHVYIQERIAESEKTRKDDEQNHKLHLRHRQCVKYHLHSKNEDSFMRFVLNFVSSFNIFRCNTQSKI